MNWKAIRKAWESGDREIAVRLLRSMLRELKYKQSSLAEFGGSVKTKGE